MNLMEWINEDVEYFLSSDECFDEEAEFLNNIRRPKNIGKKGRGRNKIVVQELGFTPFHKRKGDRVVNSPTITNRFSLLNKFDTDSYPTEENF